MNMDKEIMVMVFGQGMGKEFFLPFRLSSNPCPRNMHKGET